MNRKQCAGVFLAAAVMLTGCRAEPEHPEDTTASTAAAETTETTTQTQTETTTTAPAPEPYRFNPHPYSQKLSAEIPQAHWEAFYNLCDALRAGQTTFQCADEAAYLFATDVVVLGHLCPPACMKVTAADKDGKPLFENGIGRISYNMPAEDYVKRQAEFEKKVTEVLNTWLEPDDDDYEKCLKLYNYMESTYYYEDFPTGCGDGAYYYTFMTHKGVCDELSGIYSYLLMQVGIDAIEVGCTNETMAHSWDYVILDGKGYHIDPTWALKSYHDTDDLNLAYFMMTDAERINDGCDLEDLTVDLLPQYWANKSSLTFPADDARYYTGGFSMLTELDEKNKILRYVDISGDPCTLHYG